MAKKQTKGMECAAEILQVMNIVYKHTVSTYGQASEYIKSYN